MARGKGSLAQGGTAPGTSTSHWGHTRHLSRDLSGLHTEMHESVKKDGNQMNNKQRKLPKPNQEVRQRLTCLGFEVTAPFSSDRTTMGGVGFSSHPNFRGRADPRWAETSSDGSFPFRPCSSLNIPAIWDKAGLASSDIKTSLQK